MVCWWRVKAHPMPDTLPLCHSVKEIMEQHQDNAGNTDCRNAYGNVGGERNGRERNQDRLSGSKNGGTWSFSLEENDTTVEKVLREHSG